jgi:hypothetical protein
MDVDIRYRRDSPAHIRWERAWNWATVHSLKHAMGELGFLTYVGQYAIIQKGENNGH